MLGLLINLTLINRESSLKVYDIRVIEHEFLCNLLEEIALENSIRVTVPPMARVCHT